jgi:hypothetical protein
LMGTTSDTHNGNERLADRLAAEALQRGVPDRLAEHAAAVTARRLATRVDARTEKGRRRWRAYFWAVVRRSALRGRWDGGVTARLIVLTSLADDLRGAGYAPERVYAELCRVYGGSVAGDALERFRPRSAA